MTYEMTCIEHNVLDNNLRKNKQDLALRTIEDYLSDKSSDDDDDIKLLTIKFKKFMK